MAFIAYQVCLFHLYKRLTSAELSLNCTYWSSNLHQSSDNILSYAPLNVIIHVFTFGRKFKKQMRYRFVRDVQEILLELDHFKHFYRWQKNPKHKQFLFHQRLVFGIVYSLLSDMGPNSMLQMTDQMNHAWNQLTSNKVVTCWTLRVSIRSCCTWLFTCLQEWGRKMGQKKDVKWIVFLSLIILLQYL